MHGLWYPYAGPTDAAARIGRFADRQFGPGCGITWSDGQRVALLRGPQSVNGHGTVLNVLRTSVATPPPHPRPTSDGSFVDRAKAFFWHVMELEGQGAAAAWRRTCAAR